MTWQQWVLLVWFIIQIPFKIGREIKAPRIKEGQEMNQGDREKALAISVFAVCLVQATLIALVVSI